MQRLDDLTRWRAFWLEQDRQVLRGVSRVRGQVGVTEVRGLDVRRHRRAVVVADVESTTDGEERLTGREVVRNEGPAAAPHAELEARSAGAVRDHAVERLGRGTDRDADLSPVSDFGGDLLRKSRRTARVDQLEVQRVALRDVRAALSRPGARTGARHNATGLGPTV